ncbi:NADP-dependent isocitrate dehydrogenase [Acinetobacter baumannii]
MLHFAKALAENEQKIVAELAQVQGKPADIGGYYAVDPAKVSAVMRQVLHSMQRFQLFRLNY